MTRCLLACSVVLALSLAPMASTHVPAASADNAIVAAADNDAVPAFALSDVDRDLLRAAEQRSDSALGDLRGGGAGAVIVALLLILLIIAIVSD